MHAPLQAALEVLRRRLDPHSSAPMVVAFSGGGDSLALLAVARAFALRHGRPLAALHVDHGLQAKSGAWADHAAETAAQLGAAFHRLSWSGPKPATGLPAAARAVRHSLIAEAARALGARVVLIGHTLDDHLENALMRGAGAPVGPIGEWTPSPVWPQGRGLFLCRPLLTLRRAQLRAWLTGLGLSWIDDPANNDPRHARTLARAALGRGEAGAEAPVADLRALAGICGATSWGGIEIDRQALLGAPDAEALRLVQVAIACAAGGQGPTRPDRARGLLARLQAGGPFTATLGGARIQADGRVVLGREAGEAARGGLAALRLEPAAAVVWDGRFEVTADRPGWTIGAVRGQASRLPPSDRARLLALPSWARPSAPAVRRLDDASSPVRLALDGLDAHIEAIGLHCRLLCEERFAGAVGRVSSEVEIGTNARMAVCPKTSYVGGVY